MAGYQFHPCRILGASLLLTLILTSACSTTLPASSRTPGSDSQSGDELTGVWTGTSITGCMPLRMDGPLHCGARADLRFTIIRKASDALTGFFASDRRPGGYFFREKGDIMTVPADGADTMWMRVMTDDRASCLFDTNVLPGAMGGSYMCFRDGMSLERGHWAAWRNY